LKRQYQTLVHHLKFPPKKALGRLDQTLIEKRRQQLEAFLQGVAVSQEVTDFFEWREFLQLDKMVRQIKHSMIENRKKKN
jgi:hypothetical protein